ncbi:MAG TPA: hypothetical protein VF576_02725, partial [Rubricoccaceae bacterium]
MGKRSSRPFVQSRATGTAGQKRVVDVAAAGLPEDTRAFLVHLVASTLAAVVELVMARRDGHALAAPSVPVPNAFVREHFRRAAWPELVSRGVLSVTEPDRGAELCREYRLSEAFLDEYLAAGPRAGRVEAGGLVDLVTGNPTARRERTRWSGPSNNGWAPLAERAARAVGPSVFNADAAEARLAWHDRAVAGAADDRERDAAVRRRRVDTMCYHSVFRQGARPAVEADVGGALPAGVRLWAYTPALTPQRFGRISEVGGGLQSCSRPLKAAAREGVPGALNYDLSSSQPRFAAFDMRAAGLASDWLEAYLVRPEAKAESAYEIGVPVKTWKKTLSAVVMGAWVPAPDRAERSGGAVAAAVMRAVGPDAVAATYRRLFDHTGPLRADLALWHGHLLDVWAPANRVVSNLGGNRKTYVRNAAGATVALEDLSPSGRPHELRSKLAALVLQGLEVAVVHRIAASHAEHGFTVMSHEHDGLVTLGEIPQEAVAGAATGAGVPLEAVVLVEKP